MSRGSGAGVIFGKSGGVAEAASRTLYHVLTGKEVNNVPFKPPTTRMFIKKRIWTKAA